MFVGNRYLDASQTSLSSYKNDTSAVLRLFLISRVFL